jgi:glycosyltransferase involved in cell wall biosynthesis
MAANASKKVLALVLPIYNEEVQLEQSVTTLVQFAQKNLADFDWRIIVGDNASTDSSAQIYQKLHQSMPEVTFRRLEQKGRGRMLKAIWLDEEFDLSLYCDIDLSTELEHIVPCIEALQFGFDLAIGSRLKKGSEVHGRSLLREFTSRVYVALVRAVAGSKISDFQCGFKGITKDAALRYVPLVEDVTWFFDTELILLVEKSGGKIFEEPVVWRDDPGTTVHITKTAIDDLRGLRRILINKPWLQLKSK